MVPVLFPSPMQADGNEKFKYALCALQLHDYYYLSLTGVLCWRLAVTLRPVRSALQADQ